MLPGLEGHHGRNVPAQQLAVLEPSAPAVMHHVPVDFAYSVGHMAVGLNHIVYGAVTAAPS